MRRVSTTGREGELQHCVSKVIEQRDKDLPSRAGFSFFITESNNQDVMKQDATSYRTKGGDCSIICLVSAKTRVSVRTASVVREPADGGLFKGAFFSTKIP